MMAVAIITHSLFCHADCRDHAVQREHDGEQHDLSHNAGEAGPPACCLLLPVTFRSLMDLPCALVEQEQAARDQDDNPPGNGLTEKGRTKAG